MGSPGTQGCSCPQGQRAFCLSVPAPRRSAVWDPCCVVPSRSVPSVHRQEGRWPKEGLVSASRLLTGPALSRKKVQVSACLPFKSLGPKPCESKPASITLVRLHSASAPSPAARIWRGGWGGRFACTQLLVSDAAGLVCLPFNLWVWKSVTGAGSGASPPPLVLPNLPQGSLASAQ